MGQWTKYFADGTSYTGTDIAIAQKRASWRNSRNKGIVKVSLEYNNLLIELTGTGDYWQSDTIVSSTTDINAVCVVRRIQKRINNTDRFFVYEHNNSVAKILFNESIACGQLIMLSRDQADKWVTLEVRENGFNWYISDIRI